MTTIFVIAIYIILFLVSLLGTMSLLAGLIITVIFATRTKKRKAQNKKLKGWIVMPILLILIGTPMIFTLPVVSKIITDKTIDLGTSPNEYPVINAVMKNDYGRLEYLLKKGDNPNESDSAKVPALCYACRVGNPKLLRLLIKYHANVKLMFSDTSILYWVLTDGETWDSNNSSNNIVENISILLENGESANGCGSDGVTPLMLVCTKIKFDLSPDKAINIMKLFVKYGAKINSTDSKGRTALMWACGASDPATFPNDESNLASVPNKNYIGAINESAAKFLISNGAEISLKSNDGFTALDFLNQAQNFDKIYYDYNHLNKTDKEKYLNSYSGIKTLLS
jgi:hypothetical protein